jgi:hypothetical protein
LYADTPAAFDDVHRRFVTAVAAAVAPILAALRAEAAVPPLATLQNGTRM